MSSKKLSTNNSKSSKTTTNSSSNSNKILINNKTTDKRAVSQLAAAADGHHRNGGGIGGGGGTDRLRSADYDEISTDSLLLKPEPLDPEKYETFRRIASAEESEELDSYFNASSDEAFDAASHGSADGQDLDPQQRQQFEEEWKLELAKTEEEIQTLRQVLNSKVQRAHELKRKLGITVWKEFREDMEQGIKNIQETTAYKDTSDKIVEWNTAIQTAPIYQKTSEVVKTATEKTSSVFGSFGGSVARKLGEVKNSTAFKSFEERVGSAVTNVKTKMSTSRSNSTNSFEDALNNSEQQQRQQSLNATSPTIPEDRPLS